LTESSTINTSVTIILFNYLIFRPRFTPLYAAWCVLPPLGHYIKDLSAALERHKNTKPSLFLPLLSFFLSKQKIAILHSFSFECTSEKFIILNLRELFHLNDLYLSQVNLTFMSLVSFTTQLSTLYLPAAIVLFSNTMQMMPDMDNKTIKYK